MDLSTIEKGHRFALVIIPPEEMWKPIQSIRQEYDHKIRRWMPHITLRYPYYPLEHFEELATKIQEATQDITPFSLELGSFSFFRQRKGQYVLWLKPTPKPSLVKLMEKIVAIEGMGEEKKIKNKFHPHLTVGYTEGEEHKDALLADWNSTWSNLTFTVENIHLISREDPPNDIFQIQKTIPLGTP